MHINPVKVSFNGFAISFKILSAHCEGLPVNMQKLSFLLILRQIADGRHAHVLMLVVHVLALQFV